MGTGGVHSIGALFVPFVTGMVEVVVPVGVSFSLSAVFNRLNKGVQMRVYPSMNAYRSWHILGNIEHLVLSLVCPSSSPRRLSRDPSQYHHS